MAVEAGPQEGLLAGTDIAGSSSMVRSTRWLPEVIRCAVGAGLLLVGLVVFIAAGGISMNNTKEILNTIDDSAFGGKDDNFVRPKVYLLLGIVITTVAALAAVLGTVALALVRSSQKQPRESNLGYHPTDHLKTYLVHTSRFAGFLYLFCCWLVGAVAVTCYWHAAAFVAQAASSKTSPWPTGPPSSASHPLTNSLAPYCPPICVNLADYKFLDSDGCICDPSVLLRIGGYADHLASALPFVLTGLGVLYAGASLMLACFSGMEVAMEIESRSSA